MAQKTTPEKSPSQQNEICRKRVVTILPADLTDKKYFGKIQANFLQSMPLKISISRMGIGDYDGRKLDLDLAFDVDAELPVDPERDWEAFKTVVGQRIATLVAEKVVPGIIGELGAQHTSPAEFHVRTSNHIDNDWEIDKIGGGIITMRQSMQGTFRLQAAGDGEMAGSDLIYAARDVIAGDVANSAVFALEQRFEGKKTSDTETEINREDGQIVGYERRQVPQATAGGQSAPGSYQVH